MTPDPFYPRFGLLTMLEFTSKRIVSPRVLVTMLMLGLAFCGWVLVASPGIRPHIIVLGAIWCGALFLAWKWGGTFAKKVTIEEEQVRVVLQNGRERRFSKGEITGIEVKSQLGFKEATIRLKNGDCIRVSDQMTGFTEFLGELLGTHQHRVAPSNPHRLLYTSLVGFALFTVASAAVGTLQEPPVSTAFYAASGMAFLFVLMVVWILYVARRNVLGSRGEGGTEKSRSQREKKK